MTHGFSFQDLAAEMLQRCTQRGCSAGLGLVASRISARRSLKRLGKALKTWRTRRLGGKVFSFLRKPWPQLQHTLRRSKVPVMEEVHPEIGRQFSADLAASFEKAMDFLF